jgi:lipoyl(octanoyl) transferase
LQSPGNSVQDAQLRALEWRVSPRLVDYEQAVAAMETRVAAIRDGGAAELVWLLEHPPLYTAGTSADPGLGLTPITPAFLAARLRGRPE